MCLTMLCAWYGMTSQHRVLEIWIDILNISTIIVSSWRTKRFLLLSWQTFRFFWLIHQISTRQTVFKSSSISVSLSLGSILLCWLEMINVYVQSNEKKENQCKPTINDIFPFVHSFLFFYAQSCERNLKEVCCLLSSLIWVEKLPRFFFSYY